jgi:hypothetical protein
MKSKHYTDYISALAGISPPLQKVHYRGKSLKKPSSVFYFSCINNKGDTGKIFYNNGVSKVWSNRWFTLSACNYCDDIFAECADVTFMDAWLPEYMKDSRGMNIILIRSSGVKEIFTDQFRASEICINPISVRDMIQSQEGIIHQKKEHLAYKLCIDLKNGVSSPIKRVVPKNILWAPLQQREIKIKEQMRIISRNMWIEQKSKGTCDVKKIDEAMVSYINLLKTGNIMLRLFRLPINTIRFIQRKIRSSIHG